MNYTKTKQLTLSAVMAALSFIATFIIQIPTGTGYVHIGDSVVFLTAVVPGGFMGAAAAGFGSMLADFTAGYQIYMLPTFIIKFLMSYAAYLIIDKSNLSGLRTVLALLAGSVIMNIGYFLTGWILYGSPESGFIAFVMTQMFQVIAGFVLGYIFIFSIDKTNILKRP